MSTLSRHRDLQGAQTIFARNSGRPIVQHGLHKISDLGNIGVGESGEEVIGEGLNAATRGQKSCQCLLRASHKYRTLGSNNLGTNVITVDCLYARLDVADRTVLV